MDERYNNEFTDKDQHLLEVQCKGAFRFEQVQYVANLILDFEQEYARKETVESLLNNLANRIASAPMILSSKLKKQLVDEIHSITKTLPLRGYPYLPLAKVRKGTYHTCVNVMLSTKEYVRSIRDGSGN